MSNLFKYSSNRREQEAIDAEYRYPLTNSDGYYNWIRMGGQAPAPRDWCRGYAEQKYRNPVGWSMSIR